MSNDPKTIPLSDEIEASIERTEDPKTLAEATTADLSDKALDEHASDETNKANNVNK